MMGKIITLIIFGALYFVGYLYLVAEPDDSLRQTVLVPLGLAKKAEAKTEKLQGNSLSDIRSLSEQMDAEQRRVMRSDIYSYMEALNSAVPHNSAKELLDPPLQDQVLLDHVDWLLDESRFMTASASAPPLNLQERLHSDWGVSDCTTCKNTFVVPCKLCEKKEKEAEKAAKKTSSSDDDFFSPKKNSGITGENFLGRMEAGKTIGSIRGLGGKDYSSDSGKKTRTIVSSGANRSPLASSKTKKDESASDGKKKFKRTFMCEGCDDLKKVICHVCKRNASKRANYHKTIMLEECKKLLPMFTEK